MRVRQLTIDNFRGVKHGVVQFEKHTLLVGGNNVGKSTVCEALDLVLGPERLYRRPVVDEHDFYKGQYLDEEGAAVEIQIEAILIDLNDEQVRRFGMSNLRRWDDKVGEFIDEGPGGLARADDPTVTWALSIMFIGRYDPEEDDFIGDTFFSHPLPDLEVLEEAERTALGTGRDKFRRDHKRSCGFVFLRALRTGSRALSLQRGSLLDTILRLAPEGSAEMWQDTLDSLRMLDPAIGEIDKLKDMRTKIRENMARFVNLKAGDNATAFFASDLTREHLREVVRLFVATRPSEYPVPFARQGTGSINMLVFALLSIIAELKGQQNVIFAMEEPEIALPPHTQRRVTRFVLHEMGQSIVTSHSPYVIEQFEPADIVPLHRRGEELVGTPIDTAAIKPKTYRVEARQFAEAILSRAVLIVEGATELVVFDAASTALERLGQPGYTHIDLSGVSLFNAKNDDTVQKFAPVFKSMNKRVYGAWDKPRHAATAPTEPAAEVATDDPKAAFDNYWESPETGIERVLTKQTLTAVLRHFLDEVVTRDDYPRSIVYTAATPDSELESVAYAVLRARKGDNVPYAGLLIDQCQSIEEIPQFVRDVLLTIDADLSTIAEDHAQADEESPTAGEPDVEPAVGDEDETPPAVDPEA